MKNSKSEHGFAEPISASRDISVTMDDVVHAYRWILGREPESPEKITGHMRPPRINRRMLRLRFLRSPEFGHHLERLGILSDYFIQSAATATPLSSKESRLIYIHVPKTAGTSVLASLSTFFSADELCRHRHNSILGQSLVDIASMRLFFGHYDQRITRLLPGTNNLVFTMLREPKARLISMYRFLRAHTEERAQVEDFALAQLARRVSFIDFLDQARKLNPASVDNTYTRTYAGTLPVRRWEGKAESFWLQEQNIAPEFPALYPAAVEFLTNVDACGVLEQFDRSIELFSRRLGRALYDSPQHLQVTDKLADESSGFERVEPIEVGDHELLQEMTVWDQQLYQHACGLLAVADNLPRQDSTNET